MSTIDANTVVWLRITVVWSMDTTVFLVQLENTFVKKRVCLPIGISEKGFLLKTNNPMIYENSVTNKIINEN